MTKYMDRHDRAYSRAGLLVVEHATTDLPHCGEMGIEPRWIDTQRGPFDFSKMGRRTSLSYSIGGRNKRQRGHDHFVAGFDTSRHEKDMQRCGAVNRRDSIA